MTEQLKYTGVAFMAYVVTVKDIWSIIASIVFIIYIISMLKVNVVNKQYQGSWIKYFKSWVKNGKT